MCDSMRDRRDIRRIASEVGISIRAVQSILTNILGTSKVSARKMPQMLTDDQKKTRLNISRYLLSHGVLLLQDNSPAQTSQVTMTSATECGFEILPHSPYSPDRTPSDFFLFPKLKYHLRGTQYGSSEGVIEAVNE